MYGPIIRQSGMSFVLFRNRDDKSSPVRNVTLPTTPTTIPYRESKFISLHRCAADVHAHAQPGAVDLREVVRQRLEDYTEAPPRGQVTLRVQTRAEV
ncbi:hypothetical protein DL764_004576 [Monosporascus ibericus]|uniref:Uncharacterized protein n=1 Tax=Monosporascus ibericus TaxID=155417 RepID=A0A4Q4TFN7_9PEZI|nr:hypothetical protein DL764_004576 [Monosporascus ibericus]